MPWESINHCNNSLYKTYVVIMRCLSGRFPFRVTVPPPFNVLFFGAETSPLLLPSRGTLLKLKIASNCHLFNRLVKLLVGKNGDALKRLLLFFSYIQYDEKNRSKTSKCYTYPLWRWIVSTFLRDIFPRVGVFALLQFILSLMRWNIILLVVKMMLMLLLKTS